LLSFAKTKNDLTPISAEGKRFGVESHLKSSTEIDQLFEKAGIDVMDHDKRWGAYRPRPTKREIKKHFELLLKP
jgi:hypothetical protein